MRRPLLLLLTVALAAATGFALLGAASTLSNAPVDAPSETAGRDAVYRFYDAANAALATGDTASLTEIVASGFVDHEPIAGVTPDRAGLVRHLATLRATYPQVRLTVEALTAEGNEVMARVSLIGTESGSFLGIPLDDRLPLWGRVERFRVAGGRIAERWADAAALAVLQPLQQARAALRPPLRQAVAVERVAVAPDETRCWRDILVYGQRLLYVDAGTLTLRVDASYPVPDLLLQAPVGEEPRPAEPLAPGADVVLTPGHLLIMSDGAVCLTRGGDDAPASVWVVTTALGSEINSTATTTADTTQPEFSPRVLAGDWLARLPPGAATVAIGRATLPPGGTLPPHEVAGAELLVVEAGALTLSTSGEEAWVRRGATGTGLATLATTLTATDGAHLPAGTVGTMRNTGDEPLVVLIVTITPIDV